MNTGKKRNMLRISLIFLGIAVIFSFGINSVSAADNAPVANFTSNTTNTTSHTVQFNDTSKNHPTSWNWDFGDNSPKEIVVADTNNNAVKKIYPNGTIVTLGSGFNGPTGVVVDSSGNIYVADFSSVIKEICTNGSIVPIGSGFIDPAYVAVDSLGNIYVTDFLNGDVKKICTDSSIVLIGRFNQPTGIAVDSLGNIYVADFLNGDVKKICTDSSIVSIGRFNQPTGIAVDSLGSIYVTESRGVAVKKILTNGTVVTLGSGFTDPTGIAVDSLGNVYVADSSSIKEICTNGSIVPIGRFNNPMGVAVASADSYLADHVHTYAAPGIYTVSLTVWNDEGTSTITRTITVHYPTNIAVNPVTGYAGHNVTITANVTDNQGNAIKEGEVNFIINGNDMGNVTVVNGIAMLKYNLPLISSNYNINANYLGTTNYAASTTVGTLTVKPTANLYINTKSSNLNPTVGEIFLLTYKLSNYGPDEAKNVTITFQLPEGLEFVNIHVDNGKCTYNKTTRTVTWTLNSVPVGDPYLYLTVKAVGDGTYKITPNTTSTTYNLNSGNSGIITINVQSNNNNHNNGNQNTVNAASKITKTVGLQDTGLPLNYLLLAVLMVLGGLIPKRR